MAVLRRPAVLTPAACVRWRQVSAQGAILETAVLAPRLAARGPDLSRDPAAAQLRRLVSQHGVTLLGVRVGIFCRTRVCSLSL